MKVKKFILTFLMGLIGVLTLIPGPTQAASGGGGQAIPGIKGKYYNYDSCICLALPIQCVCIIIVDPEG